MRISDWSSYVCSSDLTEERNLADLRRAVAENNLDFGIAFDGDGDRIGAIDGEGRVVWGDQLLAILAEPVLKREPGATIIADVKASQALYDRIARSEEHTSELQSLMRISYAVFCLKKKKEEYEHNTTIII